MMPRLLSLILLTLLAVAGPARAQTTQPTQPTQPLACIFGDAGLSYGSDVIGVGAVQQIEPQWWDNKVARTVAIRAVGMIDYEDDFGPFMEKPELFAKTTAKANVAAIDKWADQCRAYSLRFRAEAPGQRLILFTSWPMGMGLQYGFDQVRLIAANRRLARSGAFDYADAVAVHAYIDQSDANWMTPDAAIWITQSRITMCESTLPEGKPFVIVVCPYYIGGGPLPAAIFDAQCKAVRDSGHELMIWFGRVDKATASRMGRATTQPTTRRAA